TQALPTAAPLPEISMVTVDLAGTLLNDPKQVTDRTAAACAALPARGIKVVIASARPPRSVRHIYKLLNLDTWQINYNGALIWDESTQSPIFHRPLAQGVARRIIDDARDLYDECQVTCEILDKGYTDRFDPTHTTETGRLFKPDVIAPLDTFCGGQVTKLKLLGDPWMMTALNSALAQAYQDESSNVPT